ncbi:M15 family metallopeptidase [Actinotalea solisilvae]|uniref:M15 family metallopeptidase n=1 Tax=Actinotalea solisilvae TaxID=2072922 RepID=UPI0018F20565|nr:M15 family metallopeptidase [Actinotalea solisilvae]
MQPEHVTVTRRELRAAAARQASHRAPARSGTLTSMTRAVTPLTLDGLRLASRLADVVRSGAAALTQRWAAQVDGAVAPARAALTAPLPAELGGQLRGGLRAVVARPGCVVLLSAAFLAGGITQVSAEQAARDADLARATAAQLEAEREAEVHARRVAGATANRMTEQAVAYAALRRNEALAVAQAAIDTAGAVVVVAAPVVAAEQISPLDAATAQLAQLVAAAPSSSEVIAPPPSLGTQAVAAMHDGDVATPVVSVAPSGATDPASTLVAEQRADDAADRSTAPTRDAAPVPASYVVPGEPLSAVADLPVVVDAPPSAPARPAPVTASATVAALDLDLTAQVVAAAQQVVTLSAQVEATAQANIAAAQAAAAAAAAAEAAARAAELARAERSRKVAVVRASDNGALPAEALCGVDFAPGVQLRCDAAVTLEQLNEAFRAHFGRDLDVVSSYRDYASQVSVKSQKGGLAAAPGTSNHGWGVAVDFDGFGSLGQFDRPTYLWMRANAGAYGWHHPSYMQPGGAGPAEPWHWEYGTTD